MMHKMIMLLTHILVPSSNLPFSIKSCSEETLWFLIFQTHQGWSQPTNTLSKYISNITITITSCKILSCIWN